MDKKLLFILSSSILTLVLLVFFAALNWNYFIQKEIGKCGDGACDEKEKGICLEDCEKETDSENPPLTVTQAKGISSISFVKKIEILDGARPEITATDSRVFVVYHTNTETFALKIFDADMNKEIVSKTLIKKSGSYGMPTDIRVASDDKYLYAFYEMANMATGRSYLFGAKYALTDDFNKISSIGPISSSKVFPTHRSGDEILDDPITLIGKNSVFTITRYKSSLEKSEDTRYKVYEFTKDLLKVKEFILNLSSVADGEARQASAIYHNGFYYVAVPTTLGTAGPIAHMTPSDITIIKLNTDWNIMESKNISTDGSNSNDAETYITGFKADSENFYLTYIQIDIPNIDRGGFTAPLKIYDKNFNLVVNEKVRTKQPGEPGLRPSLGLRGDTIFVGHDSGALGKGNAEVYIYKIKR